MSRKIYCQKCGKPWKSCAEDTGMGWRHRIVNLVAKAPDSHRMKVSNFDGVTLTTSTLSTLICDLCGDSIADGSLCFAITMWRENPIGLWEHEYGTVLSE